jgi:uncharacterized membrane protein YeaQ/YmgE (transglycosylase-associated protein family)
MRYLFRLEPAPGFVLYLARSAGHGGLGMSAILGFIWFIVMGGIIGWVASMVMNRDSSMGKFWNVVVGIIGSFLGNSVFAFLPGIGNGTIGGWPPDVMGVVSALIGAVALLGGLNLMQRGKVR